VGRAPWEKLLAAGVNCCLGTDSLASNHDLNLWNELRFMKERFAGELTLEQGIELLTVHPARAMGVDALGTIAPGKAARFATIPKDIEEMFAGS
jgi:cytosine/adenosine deaminase-related metal-dependent hydrolase